MKKLISVTGLLTLCSYCAMSQDQMVTNLLKAPTSPVAQLLNFSPSIIEKPTDLSAFWLSVKNSTNDFSKLPNSYAVDLSPAEIFKSQYQTLQSLSDSVHSWRIMKQTAVVSLGFQQFTDSMTNATYPKTGIGFKTAFFRPAWDEGTQKKFKSLTDLQDRLVDIGETALQKTLSDPDVLELRAKIKALVDAGQTNTQVYEDYNKQIRNLEKEKDSLYRIEGEGDLVSQINTAATDFAIVRQGFSLDLAGGFTAAFPTNKLNYSFADKAGVWLTGGYTKKGITGLAIVRYLYQPDSIFADSTGKLPTTKVSTLDGGVSFNYTSSDTKFNLAVEAVYRSVISQHSPVTPSWHVVLSASYSVGNNKMLSLNLGRDFDGVLQSGGNLIAGLNLILGFGGAKPIPTGAAGK